MFWASASHFKNHVITYICQKMKIFRVKHAPYQTIRRESLIIRQKSVLPNIKNWLSYGRKTVKKYAKRRKQGFCTVFRPKLSQFSIFCKTDCCLIISDSRRIVWYAVDKGSISTIAPLNLIILVILFCQGSFFISSQIFLYIIASEVLTEVPGQSDKIISTPHFFVF